MIGLISVGSYHLKDDVFLSEAGYSNLTGNVGLSKNHVEVDTVVMPWSVPWLQTGDISVNLCNFVIELRLEPAMEFSLI